MDKTVFPDVGDRGDRHCHCCWATQGQETSGMALGLGGCRAVAVDVAEGGVVLLLLLLMAMPMAVDDAAGEVVDGGGEVVDGGRGVDGESQT